MESSVINHRRYCFLKYCYYRDADDDLESVWDNKRRSIPGTDITDMFPGAIELRDSGYAALEEVQGAGADELADIGLSTQTIQAVLTALESL